MDDDIVLELWDRIKSNIPVKSRLDAADVIVSVFDDAGLNVDKLLGDADKHLTAAIISHYGIEDEEEEEDDL